MDVNVSQGSCLQPYRKSEVSTMTKQKVINFFAGPGAGKSTMTARLFSELKFRGHNSEIVTEYAKDGEWEGRTGKIRECQDYIFAKQHFRLRRLEGEVEYIITDSPILLTLVYADMNYLPSLEEVVLEAYHRFDNFNFFVKREKVYLQKGRSQTREEAVEKDEETKAMLNKYGIPYTEIDYHPYVADDIIPDMLTLHKWNINPNPFSSYSSPALGTMADLSKLGSIGSGTPKSEGSPED